MTTKSRRPGRPPDGSKRGRPLTIYLNQPRDARFQEAFQLLQTKGLLSADATLSRSRSHVIDFALQALIEKLKMPAQ